MDEWEEDDDGELLEGATTKPANRFYNPCCFSLAMLALVGVIAGALIGIFIFFRSTNVIILISLDGFRPDYLTRGVTPTLNALAASGVSAPHMLASFTTKTFPNHYTIVTGLYPESHGIVSNTIYDPSFDETYTIGNAAAVTNAKWYNGEPFWNTVIKNGYLSACYFWPGSEAPIQGIRPTYYTTYDGSVPNSERVSQVVDWLLLPSNQRPSFITLYFSTVDDAGHAYGPNSERVNPALETVDSNIAQLISELEQNNIRNNVNIIIVSDHGMTGTSPTRRRYLDDYINLDDVDIVELSVVASIIPKSVAQEETIYNQLLAGARRDGNFVPYWKNGPVEAQAPARWSYANNIRITPIIVVMETGWLMSSRSKAQHVVEHGNTADTGGNHGYDNAVSDMHALFIAQGPQFKSGVVVDPFLNIEVYNLLAAVLGFRPAPNNGTLNSNLIQQALL